ncbi:MAG: glycosyltransferase involved in cell wall biosynthesis [Phycisphaerales bacterium]|jgi:glycosyltransferase involved in cell wall biosynthesis
MSVATSENPASTTAPATGPGDAARPLRIAHYLRVIDLQEGGVIRAVLDLASEMARAGHHVTVFTCDAKDAPEDWRTQSVGSPVLVELDGPGRASKPFTAPQAAGLAERLQGFDVLHLHALWQRANPQWAGAANTAGVPYVLSTHGMLDEWPMSQGRLKKRAYHALVGSRMLRGAAAVHCTAQGELDQASRWFPRRLGRVVPLVFDLQPFDPGPGPALAQETIEGFDRGLPTVLFISRLHVKKGVEHLIRAAEVLNERGVGVTFLVAGTGDEAYTQSLVGLCERLGVTDSVRFLGMVSGELKFSLLQAADLSLLPTSQENFGFAVVEAMAGGAPIITTKGVDIWPELLASGGAVLVEQDAAQIADAVEALVNDGPRRERTGAAAKTWVFETFAGDAIVQRYEALYRGTATDTDAIDLAGGTP